MTIHGCNRDQPVHHDQFVALGTLIDVTYAGLSEEQAHSATKAVTHHFDNINKQWHAWQTSQLTTLNAALQAGGSVQADPEIVGILKQAQEVSRASNYLFNPAIGQLITLWGFHNEDLPTGPPPPAAAITPLVQQRPTLDNLIIENERLSSRNPALELDLAAFVKGYAVDTAIEELRKSGITDAIVNAGGDLRAIGSRGQRPWRIGIRHPRRSGVLASLEIKGDECVFTSGDYERFYDYQGQRYHHIIDPRTGYPARGFTSVTVLHSNGAAAYGASTALVVAGPDQWQRLARQMGVDQLMLVDYEGTIYLTPKMAQRIRFEINPPPKLIVRDLS